MQDENIAKRRNKTQTAKRPMLKVWHNKNNTTHNKTQIILNMQQHDYDVTRQSIKDAMTKIMQQDVTKQKRPNKA